MALGVALGVAGGVADSLEKGHYPSNTDALQWSSIAIGVVIFFLYVRFNLTLETDLAIGILSGLLTFIFYLRLPRYPLDWLWCLALKLFAPNPLRYHPVLFFNLSYLPYPFLSQQIIDSASEQPQLARRVLDACSIAPGQQQNGKRALAHLRIRELSQQLQAQQLDDCVALRGQWLSGKDEAHPVLKRLNQIAAYLLAAKATSLPYQRLQHLDKAKQAWQQLQNYLLENPCDYVAPLREYETIWAEYITEASKAAQTEASAEIPNPFRTGNPLMPEAGAELFNGREAEVQQIEALLADSQQNHSIALLGPRRCGKSSLLKMLPSLLPDSLCVFYDLQDNPIDSSAGLFRAIHQACLEANQQRQDLSMPDLANNAGFEAAKQWFDALEQAAKAADKRVLLCLDEFERLPELFPDNRSELLRLLGLLRAIIQHKQQVRILVSGVAAFNELDSLWTDHLINTRVIHLRHFAAATTEKLLCRPIPEFPSQTISPELAAKVQQRSDGLPFLVQFYGSVIVADLNARKQTEADVADFERWEQVLLDQAGHYFHNIWGQTPADLQPLLLALAQGQSVDLNRRQRRWLEQRCLYKNQALSIKVLGRWLREEIL